MSESYTGSCVGSVQSTFGSCAKRCDSLRQDCTNSYTALTQWPGPCECSFYAQDLMCFDQQELCASQAWSQVPQWFRDGVTSCFARDENYTIRAALGTYEVPFTVKGLAGSLATSTTSQTGVDTSETASPGGTAVGIVSATGVTDGGHSQTRLSSGSIAGVVMGVVVGLGMVVAGVLLFSIQRQRRRRARANLSAAEDSHEMHAEPNVQEGDNTAIYEKEGQEVHELSPAEPVELYTEEPALEMDATKKRLFQEPRVDSQQAFSFGRV